MKSGVCVTVAGVAAMALVLAGGCASVEWPGLEPATPARTNMVRRAVCIGWNRVDPAKWGGWNGALTDCEYDAELWYETWRDLGFEATNLLTEAATVENCRLALEWAVEGLRDGDLLVVEVSGHGGQGPDTVGEGSDGLGEYVCAYDGPVSDNTVNRWLRSVTNDVLILWGADTCHSGDLYKAAPVRFRRAAIPKGFKGQLILLAGCSEDGSSLSTGEGGLWSNARRATGPEGRTPTTWFRAAKARVRPDLQVPVYAEYGRVTDAFRNLVLAPATNAAVVVPPAELAAAPWDRATLASCWDGANAQRRMMNCLSPKFTEAKVGEYLEWQRSRGCNTVDLFVANQGDGEGAGYSIYGTTWDWSVDAAAMATMNARIERFLRAGMAVNVWLLADDSTAWNQLALGSPERYVADVARAGLLRYASSVCVGLELTEYATRGQVAAMVAALRGVYGGKVATHHNSGRLDFAGLGDLVWIQEDPGVTEAALGAAVDRALRLGCPVRCFEVDRKPNRALCEFALRRGCYAVGNW